MKKILLVCIMMCAISVSAQVRRIEQTPAQQDTVPQLSIMFNNSSSTSYLLKEAGTYQKRAISTVLIGGAVGGILMQYGLSHPPEASAATVHPITYLGGGVVLVSTVASLIFEIMSANRTQKAGEQLERISISLGGISYHF